MSYENNSNFIIVNLASQADAVAHYVQGWSKQQIIDWLNRKGELTSRKDIYGKEFFYFKSTVGFEVNFYLDADEFVFLGDHTTWKPKR